MYLNFFDFKKEPFQITPDPSFLYLSHGHREALASIIYGVEKKKGFILIVGAVGVGKTTILRAYLENTDKSKIKVIYIFDSNISYHNLLRHIFLELGLVRDSDESCHMVNQLHRFLIDEYREGKNIILLIDEAQNMPADTLENLRMLSNLETATEKLIQIIFSAQPEFEKTLNLEELKQLKQRIAVKAIISPLNKEEGLSYIGHRLKKASDKETIIFTGRALREIVRCSKGIPRVINILCDNCLISAFGYGKKKVGLGVVREILRDFGIRLPLYLQWRIYVTGVLLTTVIAGMVYREKFTETKRPNLIERKIQDSALVERKVIPSVTTVVESAAGDELVASRTVARGDTLARLVHEVYGRVDSKLIRLVKKANPSINNENLIIEGRRIVFPAKKEN
ncbi:hypothetical protein GMLC_32310 [Geomonas limicola]|uniref:AAA+ ATPase domain-containing protein n=1 Tax=Geomonas limicola TaxID=2740186 RepID=A0A6V8NAK8_9BACT|nr:AAA family ATPase [Geomonas limicola]GFO69652.1 hypothetical protein GMLC_32310 [Geomonas limicola]